MKKKLLAAVMSASLSVSTALAHTNSIGYVGDGSGGLNFWYGSWHSGTNFNEAEIKIEGTDANGTAFTWSDGNGGTQNYSIDAFNLLTASSPAGLISGVNFFTSDGSQLVAYDPTGATNGGTTQESYTWQGINYSNLSTGNYTFTYIPLGSTESSYPNGTPTMDWVPMDNVILSLSLTLTQGDLNGDANNNGILDINEVAAGASGGSGPTVVSQGSSSAIAYSAGTLGVLQTVTRTQTNTTWDNMSDGTTQNTQSSTTTLDPFVGRVDQVATASDVVGSALRTTDFTRVNAVARDNTYDNGMSGRTNGFVAGGVNVKENNIIVGGGFAKLNTDMSGNGDTVKGDTTAISGVVGKRTERGDVTARLTHGMTDYEMTRTIGDFANAGVTEGTDTSISLRFEGVGQTVGKATVSPIVGVTKGKRVTDAYTETGSTQTARTVSQVTEDYSYGTIGASIDVGLVNLVALHNTDGVNDVSLGISKETEKGTWGIRAHKTMTELGDTNSISLGVTLKF